MRALRITLGLLALLVALGVMVEAFLQGPPTADHIPAVAWLGRLTLFLVCILAAILLLGWEATRGR
jgi:hypothetical protein